MTKGSFMWLVDRVVDIYGVDSYLDNITDDMTEEEIEEDVWFATPCCEGDPVLFDDYGEEMIIECEESGRRYFICPICGDKNYLE